MTLEDAIIMAPKEDRERIAELKAQLAHREHQVKELGVFLAKAEDERRGLIKRAEQAEARIALISAMFRQKVEQLQADNARLRAALEKMEWSGHRTHNLRQCPTCFSLEREGAHSEHCFIAAALHPEQPAESEGKK